MCYGRSGRDVWPSTQRGPARCGRRREDDEVTTRRGHFSGTRSKTVYFIDHWNARAGEGVGRCPDTTATIAATAFTIAAAAYTIASTYSWRVALHEHMPDCGLRGV